MAKKVGLLKQFWIMWILGTLFPFILYISGNSSVWLIQIFMGLVFNPIGALGAFIFPAAISNPEILAFIILTLGQLFTTVIYTWIYNKLES